MVSSITASLKVSLIGDGRGDADGDDAERKCPFPRVYGVVLDDEVVCIAGGRSPAVAVEVDVDGVGVGVPSELGRSCRC